MTCVTRMESHKHIITHLNNVFLISGLLCFKEKEIINAELKLYSACSKIKEIEEAHKQMKQTI